MEELQELLGLDIPPIPEVSLAGITPDSVLLYWKPPDNQVVSLKHTIEVNGIKSTHTLKNNQISPAVLIFKSWRVQPRGHFYPDNRFEAGQLLQHTSPRNELSEIHVAWTSYTLTY